LGVGLGQEQNINKRPSAAAAKAVTAAVKYIEASFEQPIKLADIARAAKLNACCRARITAGRKYLILSATTTKAILSAHSNVGRV